MRRSAMASGHGLIEVYVETPRFGRKENDVGALRETVVRIRSDEVLELSLVQAEASSGTIYKVPLIEGSEN